MENGVEHIYVQSFPTLYKYQSSTEYSLHNFEADEIWGTVPSSFNIKEAYEDLFLRIKQKYYSELEKNNDLFYSMMCRKSKVWNYEQEWRIWTYNSNVITGNFENPYMKIGNLKAKAVYLGERMPEYMRRVILEIAKMKQIPVYQMKSVMYKHCYKLKPILIQSN